MKKRKKNLPLDKFRISLKCKTYGGGAHDGSEAAPGPSHGSAGGKYSASG